MGVASQAGEEEVNLTNAKNVDLQAEGETDSGMVVNGLLLVRVEAEGAEDQLFEDLLESLQEAGALMRGEREAARRTRFDEIPVAGEGRGRSADSDSGEGDC